MRATNIIDSVGNKTTMVYNALNRLTQQTDPLGNSGTFAYDAAGRMTSTTDRDGRQRNFSFDNANRKTGETWVSGGSTVNVLTYTYDNNANVLTAADYHGTYTMAYDALNRATATQEPFSAILTATYDAVGNRTVLQDSFGGVLTSVYDTANRLTKRQFSGNSTSLEFDLGYTARNQLASVTRYKDLGTTTIGSSAYTYDGVGRLTNLQHKDGNNNGLANYTYSYDLASRLTQEQDNGTTTNYGYDATNQLTSAGSSNYSYDLNGNRTMSGYQTGTENEITNDGVWTYTYDAEGNITQKSKGSSAETWTFGYDNLNHMIWAQDRQAPGGTLTTTATYTYDVFGNRLEKDVWTSKGGLTTTRFAYDGQDVWADLNSSNQLQTRYIRGDVVDQIFARVSSEGTAAWYLIDRQGSVRNLTDASGTLQDTITYDGFGNATESNSTFGDRYKYTGREFDSETGLQYNRARYYDPKVGRWTSQDPIGFDAGDSNLYRYVHNSSTIATDPSGLKICITKITVDDTGKYKTKDGTEIVLGAFGDTNEFRYAFTVKVEADETYGDTIKNATIFQDILQLTTVWRKGGVKYFVNNGPVTPEQFAPILKTWKESEDAFWEDVRLSRDRDGENFAKLGEDPLVSVNDKGRHQSVEWIDPTGWPFFGEGARGLDSTSWGEAIIRMAVRVEAKGVDGDSKPVIAQFWFETKAETKDGKWVIDKKFTHGKPKLPRDWKPS